jgi:hypothetical protein
MKKDELIEVHVRVSAGQGRSTPPGYRFAYASDSPCVDTTGNIDLSGIDKDDVTLRFRIAGAQFDTRDPVWIEVATPGGPAPCPSGVGNQSAFKKITCPDASTLQFVDKNKDGKRYAYAIRCVVGGTPVMDDPVIINR